MYILNKIYKLFFFIPKKRMKYVVGLFSVIIQEKVTPVFWQKNNKPLLTWYLYQTAFNM